MLGYIFSDSAYDSFLEKIVKSFSSSTLKNINKNLFFPLRRQYLSKKLSSYLLDNFSVLDLGSSDGRLANKIGKELQQQGHYIELIGCDIHVQPHTHIPIVKYDGKNLPFDDNSFDSVLIVDVLHHTENPLKILKEASRVSRNNILIKDHYWETKKDFIRLKHADYIGNKPYGIPLPNNFLNKESWQNLIEICSLFVIDCETYEVVLDPCKHIIYKLQVNN